MTPRPFALAAVLVLPLALAGCAEDEPAPVGASKVKFRTLWSVDLLGKESAYSSPLLVDVNGDGVLDVIAANGEGHTKEGSHTETTPGELAAFDGRDGRKLWASDTSIVDASPVIADVDGDRRGDLFVGLRTRGHLARIDAANGAITSTTDLANWVHTPAIADVDGDGALDVLVVNGGDDRPDGGSGRPGTLFAGRATDLSKIWAASLPDEAYSSPAVADGLVFHGLGGQLGKPGGFEARHLANGTLAWRENTRTGVLSSPAVVDLDGDGKRDVVFMEWWGRVHARRADGSRLWSVDANLLIWSSPAIADVNSDGRPDVIVSAYWTKDMQLRDVEQFTNGKYSLSRGIGGAIFAYDGPTGKVLWTRTLAGTPGSPVTADVTGDGVADVIVTITAGEKGYFGGSGVIVVLDGKTGVQIGGEEVASGAIGTPAVADVNSDGFADVALVTMSPGTLAVYSVDVPTKPHVAWSWPRFRGNERGTGVI